MRLTKRHYHSRGLAAYILLELSIASLIASVMMLGICAVMIMMLRAMILADDLNAAHNRAEMVFSILRQPLEQCGYGMPKDNIGFNASFNINGVSPFGWKGAISVTSSYLDGLRENGSCRIAYAISSNIRVNIESETSGDKIEVLANGAPPLLVPAVFHGAATSVKNWAVFGAMLPNACPLWISEVPKKMLGGTMLSFRRVTSPSSDANILIPENDELFYLRAMECRVIRRIDSGVAGGQDSIDYNFYTFDHMGTGWQPRVSGVIDARFELDPGGRLVRVTTLTRGNKRHNKKVSPHVPDGWPEKYADAIPDDARYYVLLGRSSSFELQNF